MKVLNSQLTCCGDCPSRMLQIDTEHGVSRCKVCGAVTRATPVFVEMESLHQSESAELFLRKSEGQKQLRNEETRTVVKCSPGVILGDD